MGALDLSPKVAAFVGIIGVAGGTLPDSHLRFRIGVKPKNRSKAIGEKLGHAASHFGTDGLRTTELLAALIVTGGLRSLTEQLTGGIQFNDPPDSFGRKSQIIENLARW